MSVPRTHRTEDSIFQFGIFRKAKYTRRVKKSIYSADQEKLLALLRKKREQAHLTQVELAERLGRSQSFISKYESGELCLDLLSLRQVCHVLGVSLPAFVKEFESQLS